MFFIDLQKLNTRRIRWFGRLGSRSQHSQRSSSLLPSFVKIRKRHKLQLIVALMSLNILISLSILNQQSRLTNIFDKYFTSVRYECDNNELLKLLNSYRSKFNKVDGYAPTSIIQADSSSLSKKAVFTARQHRTALSATENSAANSIEYDDLKLKGASASLILSNSNEYKINDYYFNGDFIVSGPVLDSSSSSSNSNENGHEFYSPKILIENREACSPPPSELRGRRQPLFAISLIHSHYNNYLRRKTMRETWLSMRRIRLADLYPRLDVGADYEYELHFAHLFVIGNDQTKPDVLQSIRNESLLFNDILMIDVQENYKNLIYKHLALVNWVNENCRDVSYIMKLDDDVLINIKSLTRHLIEKFHHLPSTTISTNSQTNNNQQQFLLPSSSSLSSKFLYCNINKQSRPMRHNTSKWFVHPDTYPFEWYPNYCEGFAYITNMQTIRFMSEQSKRIPRFWIDDVYFTGLLFHGVDDVKWIDYKGQLSWSYYDFWDLGNTLSIYELYAYVLKLFNISVVDYYKSNHFIILHSQPINEEVNYTMNAVNISFTESSVNGGKKSQIKVDNESRSIKNNSNRTKSEICQNSVLKLISTPTSIDDEYKSNFSSNNNAVYNYLECLDSITHRKFILDIYFYDFCHKLWKNNFL